MRQLDLRTRLFFSYMVVMFVGLTTLLAVGKIYSPRLFIEHLQRLEVNGMDLFIVKRQLLDSFDSAWTRGAFWSLVIGGLTASSLSYWVTSRIIQPLTQMQRITQNFAAGQLSERMPSSEIPELDRLSDSFNRMALALEDVEARRRDLVSDLTHELRTPLTIVQGYLEGMGDGTITPTPEIYDRLTRETNRLRRLVNDLQELSKAEAGYLTIKASPIDLQPILRSLTDRFGDQIADSAICLKLDCPPCLPLALADPERTEQILVNLLGNALRYTEAGTVTLSATPQGKQLWIAVADTGKGIAPEDLPHVFERFWRSDRSRNRDSGGTGIGLSISKRLVELQQGTLEVTSVPNEGSTFRFSVPLA
ncbi:MAG: HAMP domain-containing histidine kinase [Alkalinema sp. RU_4_3]|nr:HAMP domain-containing histidine kinase [Alkalinema sp. RU_4_3]